MGRTGTGPWGEGGRLSLWPVRAKGSAIPVPQASLSLSTGDPSPARREGVKKKAAEYLKRAEEILHLHLSQPPP